MSETTTCPMCGAKARLKPGYKISQVHPQNRPFDHIGLGALEHDVVEAAAKRRLAQKDDIAAWAKWTRYLATSEGFADHYAAMQSQIAVNKALGVENDAIDALLAARAAQEASR